jgi:hypothetical protein
MYKPLYRTADLHNMLKKNTLFLHYLTFISWSAPSEQLGLGIHIFFNPINPRECVQYCIVMSAAPELVGLGKTIVLKGS